MKNILKFGFIFILAITLVSCGGDDEPADTNNPTRGTFTAKLNGEDFVATSISTGQILQVTAQEAQRFDITASNDVNVFNFAIENPQISDCMPVGEYVDSHVLIFLSFKTSDGRTVQEHSPLDDNGDVVLTASVTSCSDNKMSGTFSGIYTKVGSMQDEFVTPETIIVTEGKFENIPYQIITN